MAPAVKAKAPDSGKAKEKTEKAKTGKDAKAEKTQKENVQKAVKPAKLQKPLKATKVEKVSKDAKGDKKPEKKGKDSKVTKKLKGVKRGKIQKKKPRTTRLSNGVYLFGKSRLICKKGKFRVVPKEKEKVKKPSKPTRIVKKIGGEKNGETREVLVKKRKNYYPTAKK